jgi:SAM-dependent methyltransferase
MSKSFDVKGFWESKIIEWEESRYQEENPAPTLIERIAGRISSSLRFRVRAAAHQLAPVVAGRHVVELGCGSGILAQAPCAAGAESYLGVDISENAVQVAQARVETSPHAGKIRFQAGSVDQITSTGDAIVFSLGLFDWLTDAEIRHVLSLSRFGSYYHAVAEKRNNLTQLAHRLYVHVSYGHRTGGYVPQYHSIRQMGDILAELEMPPPNVVRHPAMRFGIFVTDLDLREIPNDL